MSRTTEGKVEKVIDTSGAAKQPVGLDKHIETASVLVDYIESNDSGSVLTTGLKIEIETYLAAHFYALQDPQYQSEKAGGAGGTYQGQTGKGLELTWWGQQAILLDVSGQLSNIQAGNPVASLVWLGKPPSTQIPYSNRD